jgi:hypothetical protein
LDEIALKRKIQQAAKTEKLIATYQEYWDELEADIWKMWRDSKSHEKEGREDLYREQHAIRRVQARLHKIVSDGKRAEEELKHVNRNST